MHKSAVVVLVSASLVIASCGERDARVASGRSRPSGARGAVNLDVPTGALAKIADSPLQARTAPAVASMGSKFVVYGGRSLKDHSQPVAGGALYDPRSDSWEELPALPFSGQILDPTLAAVRGGFVLAGARCDGPVVDVDEDGVGCSPGTATSLRFDVSDKRWSELPVPASIHVKDKYVERVALGLSAGSGAKPVLVGALAMAQFDDDSRAWAVITTPEPAGIPCAAAGGLVAASLPDRVTVGIIDVEPGAANVPRSTTASSQRLGSDGTWTQTRNEMDLGPLPEAWLVSCTPTGLVAMADNIDEFAFGIAADAKSGAWRQIQPPPDLAAPVAPPSETAPVLVGTNAVATFDGDSWRIVKAEVQTDVGEAAVNSDGVLLAVSRASGSDQETFVAGKVA
jgi:hypothetical protein